MEIKKKKWVLPRLRFWRKRIRDRAGIFKRETGFTLLELVISVTILTLILGVILGAMRLGSRSWEVEEKRVERLQRMRVTYDIISEDVKSILCNVKKCVCPGCSGCKHIAHLFIGGHDRIKFVSANPGIGAKLSRSGYRVASYYLGQDYNTEYEGVVLEESKWLFPDFFRFDLVCDTCDSESNDFESESNLYVIYPDVTEMTFQYYGTKNGEAEPDWYDTWNALEDICSCDPGYIQESLPEKVRIRMLRPPIKGQKGEEEPEEVVIETYIECGQGT